MLDLFLDRLRAEPICTDGIENVIFKPLRSWLYNHSSGTLLIKRPATERASNFSTTFQASEKLPMQHLSSSIGETCKSRFPRRRVVISTRLLSDSPKSAREAAEQSSANSNIFFTIVFDQMPFLNVASWSMCFFFVLIAASTYFRTNQLDEI